MPAKRDTTAPHEYAKIFPLAEGPPLWELADNIKEHGQLEPIILYKSEILDGRRRELACFRAGVTPRYEKFKGTEAEALEFVMSKNLHRRHLTDGDRVLAAAKYAQHRGGKPSQNATVSTNSDAAQKFDVSEAKVDRAKKVVKQGTEKLQDAVAKDEVSVSDAAKVADQPAKVQDAAVDAVRNGKARTASAAAESVKQAKEPPDDDEPWVDGWGIPITKEAEPAFLDQEKFDELLKLLRQAKRMYKELAECPGGKYLQQSYVSANTRSGFVHSGLDTCIMNVADCRPTYTVCPYAYHKHAKHDKACSLCHGLGWVCQVSKTNGPPAELIAAAKQAHGITD